MSIQSPEQLVAAERGLALLAKRQRTLHPRAQVQTLRRIAVRAMNEVDRSSAYLRQFGINGFDTAPDPAAAMLAERQRIGKLRAKAVDATEAMVKLNADHTLGYPVPR